MKIESKVTLALMLAIALQAAGVLIWAGAAGERIAGLEAAAREGRPIVERLARVEAELAAMRVQLDRIERRMEARDGGQER
jgi:hypothetical protein